MLNIVWLSVIAALVSALPSFIVVIAAKADKNFEDKKFLHTNIISSFIFFVIGFLYMSVFFYLTCKAQTIITVIIWIWPILLVNDFIFAFTKHHAFENPRQIAIDLLFVISFLFFISSLLITPVQNLIYVHDTEEIDIAYSISSEEVLARIEIGILNGGRTDATNKYQVDNPEMRRISKEDIAVYHIKNPRNDQNLSEYIPGYIVMANGEFPQFISKRIYFDNSYCSQKDAYRTVRRAYPTIYIGDHTFDVDDEYNPYEIYEYRENLFFSDGEDYGIITLSLYDGTATKYLANEVPSWIDFKTTAPK